MDEIEQAKEERCRKPKCYIEKPKSGGAVREINHERDACRNSRADPKDSTTRTSDSSSAVKPSRTDRSSSIRKTVSSVHPPMSARRHAVAISTRSDVSRRAGSVNSKVAPRSTLLAPVKRPPSA